MRAHELTGDTMIALGKRYGISGVSAWHALRAPEPPNPLVLPYYPPVYALAGKLAVVVADPAVWDVHSIQATYRVEHAVAVKWFRRQREHLDLMGVKMLLLWAEELKSPALAHILRYRLQEGGPRIGARSCEVCQPDGAVAEDFYNRYHLQGSSNSRIHYGLRGPQGDLVAVMAFNSSETCRGAPGGWLLQRFATSTVVPGAASRLLAAFRADHPGFVVSYSDERYAPGGALYSALGFTREAQEPKPDYRYWRQGIWYAKSAKQRKDLILELGTPDAGATEFEMAAALGYKRCYDLGKVTWTLSDHPVAPKESPRCLEPAGGALLLGAPLILP
jgi:hypothetical protein